MEMRCGGGGVGGKEAPRALVQTPPSSDFKGWQALTGSEWLTWFLRAGLECTVPWCPLSNRWVCPKCVYVVQGRGGVGGLRLGSVKPNCEKLRENCGKMAVLQPNLPKPQGATPLHRGHTGHQHTREGDEQKAIAENCEKLRKIAHFNPPPPLCNVIIC